MNNRYNTHIRFIIRLINGNLKIQKTEKQTNKYLYIIHKEINVVYLDANKFISDIVK